MTTVFISHSARDRAFVEHELAGLLNRHGIDTWHMQTGIHSASDWANTVLKALVACEWFLVVLSPHSVASEWVKDEVHWAIAHRQGRIITVLIEESDSYELHIRLPRIQYIDFRKNIDAARQRLLMTWHTQFRPAPRTEMQLLVEKHSYCRYQNGRLTPCQYHRDRIEVGLYEKSGYDGEFDLSDTHVRLTPHPQLLDLFARMQMKTQVAGHWGLMKGHKDWLADGIRANFERRVARGNQHPIRILQCGVAGPVHYFANLAILVEELDRVTSSELRPPTVILSTRDICAGSTRPIQVLLERLHGARRLLEAARTTASFITPFRYIDVDGCVITIDESFWKLANRIDLLDPRVEHDLAVQDLTSNAWSNKSGTYDVILSHHLFSMWNGGDTTKVKSLCKNLREHTNPGSELLLAMSTNRNDPSRMTLSAYHKIFDEYGFDVNEARLAWDVYDLDRETIDRVLVDHREVDVVKDCALVRYIRTSN